MHFFSNIAGVTHENRQTTIRRLSRSGELDEDTELVAVRKPDNPFDGNAIALYTTDGQQLGFFKREVAERIAPILDTGGICKVAVSGVTGGYDGRNWGINIRVEIEEKS